ncbi:hypothetical protein AJ78_06787 [Emergomyces pasteurianus Ep9510]|uniref:Uncharacterized protein n=1 Tax=Emergomyces pasteurianus Ep9510 TaxID=1447872 RepID=A0A1J9P866_9EURO|nr:hypothetical protein AJ78_06787 [Emergomyces pasteurianus Ep9510]
MDSLGLCDISEMSTDVFGKFYSIPYQGRNVIRKSKGQRGKREEGWRGGVVWGERTARYFKDREGQQISWMGVFGVFLDLEAHSFVSAKELFGFQVGRYRIFDPPGQFTRPTSVNIVAILDCQDSGKTFGLGFPHPSI